LRPKIVSTFNNIDDAKNAFGQIKKESWNKANFAVVFADAAKITGNFEYEFATENFLGEPATRQSVWPGVREVEMSGVGKVYLGTDLGSSEIINGVTRQCPNLKQQLQAEKIIAILEVSPEIKERVEAILANNSAEIIDDQVTV